MAAPIVSVIVPARDAAATIVRTLVALAGQQLDGGAFAAGALIGIGFAIALNLWMVSSFEMVRMNNSRAIVGAAIILLLGQCAVLWPAIRAASIPPALATRGG